MSLYLPSTARNPPFAFAFAFAFEFEAAAAFAFAAGALTPTVDDTSDFWLDGIPLPSRFRPGIIAPVLLRTSPERNVPAK